jgi:uncharacterized protein YcfL
MAARITSYIQIVAWVLLALAGCGGSGNIPVASVLSSGRVTLSWDNVPGAASYELYISTSPGVTILNSYKIDDVTPPLTITDLEPGTTYYFMVAVFSDTGESRTSEEIAYTVTDADGQVDFGNILAEPESAVQPQSQAQPTAKTPASAAANESSTRQQTRLPATAVPAKKRTQTVEKKAAVAAIPSAKKAAPTVQKKVAETQDVTVAWDNVPNATSYNIYWSDQLGVNKKNGKKIANATNPYKFKNLIKGKKYYFVVTAVNASGESEPSEEFSFTVGK